MEILIVICVCLAAAAWLFWMFWREEVKTNRLLKRDRNFWLGEYRQESIRHHELVMWIMEGEGEGETPPPSLILVKGGLEED